jgi:very-short-patch-repair endonuclease
VKADVITEIKGVPIRSNFIKNLPHNPNLKQHAINNRKAGVLSEVLFWQQVHKRKFYAIDFDRQRIIGNYIVDFYVKRLGLVVEIDGSSHDFSQKYDFNRQGYLEKLGLKVFRITDRDVKKHIGKVLTALELFIIQHYGVTME